MKLLIALTFLYSLSVFANADKPNAETKSSAFHHPMYIGPSAQSKIFQESVLNEKTFRTCTDPNDKSEKIEKSYQIINDDGVFLAEYVETQDLPVFDGNKIGEYVSGYMDVDINDLKENHSDKITDFKFHVYKIKEDKYLSNLNLVVSSQIEITSLQTSFVSNDITVDEINKIKNVNKDYKFAIKDAQDYRFVNSCKKYLVGDIYKFNCQIQYEKKSLEEEAPKMSYDFITNKEYKIIFDAPYAYGENPATLEMHFSYIHSNRRYYVYKTEGSNGIYSQIYISFIEDNVMYSNVVDKLCDHTDVESPGC